MFSRQFDLKELLLDLPDRISEVMEIIIQNGWLRPENIDRLTKIILDCSVLRVFLIEKYVELAKELSKIETLIRKSILDMIIADSSNYYNTITYMRFLKYSHLYQIYDINTLVVFFSPYPNTFKILCCFFPNEIQMQYPKLFRMFLTFIGDDKTGSLCKFYKENKDTELRNHKVLTDYTLYSYPKNSEQYCLKYDIIEKYKDITNGFGFSFTNHIQSNPYDSYMKLVDNQPPLDFTARYGSIKCFRFILVNEPRAIRKDYLTITGSIDILHLIEEVSRFTKQSLYNCMEFKHHDIVKWMIGKIDSSRLIENQILCRYIREGNIPMVSFLIENGFSPKLVQNTETTHNNVTNIQPLSPFGSACLSGDIEMIKFIHPLTDIIIEKTHQQTPLHLAALSKNREAFEYILANFQYTLDQEDDNGITPRMIIKDFNW